MSDITQNVSVKVVDMMGKVIYTEDVKEFSGIYIKQINLSDYTKGVYFLRISSDQGGINKKITLQ